MPRKPRSPVLRVDQVVLSLTRDGATLYVNALGWTPSPGWKSPRLERRMTLSAPGDGIYDVGFSVVPPEGTVPQVLVPVTAELAWPAFPPGLKGVRVAGATGPRTALLADAPAQERLRVRGALTREGIECRALRTAEGDLFTLAGDLSGYETGEEVEVDGIVQDVSYCMQGTTLSVLRIVRVSAVTA